MDIERGTLLTATSARGDQVRLRALDRPQAGRDFVVVWACADEAYSDSVDRSAGLPWAVEDVRVVRGADA